MGRLQGQRALVARTVAQNDENENQLGGDIHQGGGQQGGDQPPPVLHQWWKYLKPLDLSSRVHIVQEGGCSNNLELIKDHTNSLVAVEAARVVLRRLEPV